MTTTPALRAPRLPWRQRWGKYRRQGIGQLFYRLVRHLLDRGGGGRRLDLRLHEVIGVAPGALRAGPRGPRQMQVRELGGGDLEALAGLRPAQGMGYAERFAQAHRGLGAFLEGRLVAFLWMRRGPARLPSALGAVWQLPASMAWLYDLCSDPEVLGAMPHLYGYLREHPPGRGCRWLVGQTEFDNLRSRQAHARLGYRRLARLWSLRVGKRWYHLSRAADGWRWHGPGGLIPLHVMAGSVGAGAPAAEGAAGTGGGGNGEAELELQCACGRRVGLAGEVFACVCGRELGRMKSGLAAVGPPLPYWGEIPEAQMRAVVEQARQAGWRAAVGELEPGLRDYVGAEARADFHEVLPLAPGARILDVGAGWGGIAAPLAQHYRVVALEGVPERAQMIALRQQQDGLAGLSVINGDVHSTPLGLEQFDGVVANGILEWVALADTSAPPRAVQVTFLNRLRELLTPGGMIYLGIENRIGWSELRGAADHSGLRYTSLMPRMVARWVCAHSPSYRAHFNLGYRTYTYTHRGFAKLFAEAGLRIRTTWISPQGYNRPVRLIPLHRDAIGFAQRGNGAGGRGWRRLAQRARRGMARTWVWRWIGSDFVFLLEAAGPGQEAAGRGGAGSASRAGARRGGQGA